ncbi:hypothetical protein SY94_5207 (plasmid) [Agrobacterium tumefaciens]|nr:hypothetical protein SY94_5207 [Agrobacterium tumefaciens]
MSLEMVLIADTTLACEELTSKVRAFARTGNPALIAAGDRGQSFAAMAPATSDVDAVPP